MTASKESKLKKEIQAKVADISAQGVYAIRGPQYRTLVDYIENLVIKERAEGYARGYDEDFSSSHDADRSESYEEGYDAGYEEGERVGYNSSREESDAGYTAGYEAGYEDGERVGHDAGVAEGYSRGYDDGVELSSSTMRGITR